MLNLKFKKIYALTALIMAAILALTACSQGRVIRDLNPVESPRSETALIADTANVQNSTVKFTLKTEFGAGGMRFEGVGGEIDGVVNPTLRVSEGDTVEILLVNADGMEHDIVLPDLNAHSEHVFKVGEETTLVFEAGQAGEFVYYCSIPGHRQAGMEGRLLVGDVTEVEPAIGVNIVRDPADLPGPLGDRPPQFIQYEIETIEVEGQLADGTTFTYWTFDGTVPGPFLRVRVGDTVEVVMKNSADSSMTHSIDFHAVTGPGGGAAVTQAIPGEDKSFTFKALNPGLYVYHCATPMVAHHIANGMYGLILVEPEGGLPPVDREFYVMQGELYTEAAYGEKGQQVISIDKLLAENPEYFVFNGSVDALTIDYPLQANVGETVRIYFGVGGPNFISSFHVIGEIFDRVYDQASLTSPPLTDVQTTLVPPGGAAVVEFELDYPGRYILVDHALSRAERGLVGFLLVEGEANPDIFHSDETMSDEGH
jgi:nitrite reductase (NO-forming)